MSESRAFQFSNNARSTLLSGISAAATQLSVQIGAGSAFPEITVPGGQIFAVLVWDSSLSSYEIMYCTARSGDILTVERGKEGTVARAFSAGDVVVHNVTAAFFDRFVATPPPSAVVLSGSLVGSDVHLSWTASTPQPLTTIEYLVYRRVDGSSYSLLTTQPQGTLSYIDVAPAVGHDYDYFVVVDPSDGPLSANSNVVSIDIPTPPPAETFVVVSQDQKHALLSSDGDVWTQSSGTYATAAGSTIGLGYSPTLARLLLSTSQNFLPDNAFSDDGGDTWTAYNMASSSDRRVRWAFSQFFIPSVGGIRASSTGLNGSWSSVVTGATDGRAFDYSAAENRLACLFSQTAGVPSLQYTDDGAAWHTGSVTGLPSTNISALARDDSRGAWYCVIADGTIYSTVDIVAGTWTILTGTTAANGNIVGAIAFKPGGAGQPIVVANGDAHGFYVSLDDGASFTQFHNGATYCDAIWSASLGKFIVVGIDNGGNSSIYTSAHGVTWTAASSVPNVGTLIAIAKIT